MMKLTEFDRRQSFGLSKFPFSINKLPFALYLLQNALDSVIYFLSHSIKMRTTVTVLALVHVVHIWRSYRSPGDLMIKFCNYHFRNNRKEVERNVQDYII